MDSVALYNMTKNKKDGFQQSMNTRVVISNKEFDNENYDKNDDIDLVDEYKEYNRNMSSIKQTYSEFNKKVTEYQRAMNRDVTDKIDEKMMLREHDNY